MKMLFLTFKSVFVVVAIIALVAGMGKLSQSGCSIPSFSQMGMPENTERYEFRDESMRVRHLACKQACGVLYGCGMYLQNEFDKNMEEDQCAYFCTYLPDSDWLECTMRYYKEQGCCGKAFGLCATYLPDPK